MRRTPVRLACVGAALLVLAGCTSGTARTAAPSRTAATSTSAPAPTASPTPTPAPKKAAPRPRPRTVEPLTGLPVHRVARRPVLVVKVENSVDARPQTGLDRADIVVEELVEGGITRFAAMFHSVVPPTVGPVRSLRDVDTAIAGPTRGLLVASGGAGVVRARVERGAAQVVLPTSTGGSFRRSGYRVVPHNLYVDARNVLHAARRGHRSAPRSTYLPFAATVAQSTAVRIGQRTGHIDLSFSPTANPRWTYDPRTRNWLRSEGATPSRLTDGRRMAARTVLVLRVHTRDAGYRDPAGNYVPRTVFTGRGNAMMFCEGRRISARWSKRTPSSPLRLVTLHGGKPLLVAPGRTWIEMLTTSGTLRTS